MKDAFERRAPARQSKFLGPVSTNQWDTAYGNYCNLVDAGYKMRVFLNDREVRDCISADPDAGTVTCLRGVLKGSVEIRLERP